MEYIQSTWPEIIRQIIAHKFLKSKTPAGIQSH